MDSCRLKVRVKHFTAGMRITLWLTLLALLYVVIWLQGGVRDMNWARNWLLGALNPADAPYSITIGDVAIDWQNITDFGQLHVNDLRVAQKDGAVFATLPEVDLTLDLFGFLPRRRALHGIEINRAKLLLLRDEAGVIRLGAEGVQEPLPLDALLASFGGDDNESERQRGRLPFRALRLNEAALTFTDLRSNATLVSDPFSLLLARRGRDMRGSLTMPFLYKERPGSIDASLYTQRVGHNRILNARLEKIPGELICIFATCPEGTDFTGAISGKLALRQEPGEGVEGDFAFTTAKARLTAPTLFPEPLKLMKAGVLGSVAEGGKQVHVEGLTLELPDTNIAATADLSKSEAGWSARGSGTASQLAMDKLQLYWPLVVAPDTRDWVRTHITEGVAESATLKFDLTPEDIASEFIRDEAIDSTVIAKGLTVDYIPGFPLLKAADGTVHFTGKTMHVEATSGSLMTATKLNEAVLDCANLDDPKAPMTTTLKLSAPAGDVVTMLKLPPFTFDDKIPLNAATIKGTVDATLKLGFDGFSGPAPENPNEVDFSNVKYDIEAVLNQVGQPKLLDGRDISGLSGTLKASDAGGVSFDGNVKVDGGTNVALTLKDENGVTIASAKGTLARRQFSQFGIPEISQLGEGSVGVDAQIRLAKEGTSLQRAVVDLTPIALHVPEISWSKNAGAAASLSLAPGKTANSYTISAKAPDLTVSDASLQLTPAMDDVAALNLGRVKNSKNDFSLSYKTTGNGFDVVLKGARLDHSQAFAQPSEGGSIFADFPPINLTVDLGELVLVPDLPLRSLKGGLSCNRVRCASADLSAQAGKSSFSARIINSGGARRLVVYGSDAGDLLRATDISDRMFGGTLDLKGAYDDTQTPPVFKGRFIIERFKLRNSEILARIISIGSLSGLMNVLTGEGIDFKKMAANVQAKAGVFTITEGQADSNALGLTLNGRADMAKHTLNLKGVVVPANSLNSLFGKIPLIGKLAGEGDALIGFNYSVKGSMSDPEVFVNPLSGLTPGFLRGIFNIGDDPTAEPAPSPKQAPEAGAGEEPTRDVHLPSPRRSRK